ncbi:MAG TPA: HAMP domain-containing sensor histidine kinase [Puia sp.]|nr:HAMP domain-containing sensor histidine kinase [Puia sp.]
MFLTKKWIFSIIAVTGISFMILLVIQFGWIRKSIDINRRRFADRMVVVTNNIRDAFLQDKSLQNKYLTSGLGRHDLFVGDVSVQRLEGIIKQKLDSVLEAYQMPLSTSLTGRLDSSCYHMYYVPTALRSQKIDHSPYKICLCSNNYKGSLDIGFELFSDNMLIRDTSGLILPSVMLILLLIVLFAYIINVVNRQKRLAELKNDFINNLTHEFNTPLFSIGLTSSLLARSEPVQQSEKLKGYIELITTEKNRLQTQVDKILRLTAVESASLIMEKVDVDIHEIIRQNVAAFLPVITERGGLISFSAGATHHIVSGDPVHVYNAISNLVDNAVKYSKDKPDVIIETNNAKRDILICIRDNGIGMNASDLQMIFNKFYRVKHGDRHDVKGFGIGLSYVKKIIELHKGSIEAKSIPGEGSAFIIQLPFKS